jgi:hypothetical protein
MHGCAGNSHGTTPERFKSSSSLSYLRPLVGYVGGSVYARSSRARKKKENKTAQIKNECKQFSVRSAKKFYSLIFFEKNA